MTCSSCGRWAPPDPQTGYDADEICPRCAERYERKQGGDLKVQLAFDRNINLLYFSDLMDESVLISLRHKKRKGSALSVVLSRSVTVRHLSLDAVHHKLRDTFKPELNESPGLYERPDEKVLIQMQYYKRGDASQKAMEYLGSKSLTIPGVNLQAAMRRIKAAFTKSKR